MVMLQVVVKIHQGVLDEVDIYTSEAGAKADFEKYTGVTFEEYSKRLKEDESSDEILGNTEGTEILEIDFKAGLLISEEDIVENLRDELEREPNPDKVKDDLVNQRQEGQNIDTFDFTARKDD